MRQIKQLLWMLLGVVAFIGFTSCDDDIVKYHNKEEVSGETGKDDISDLKDILITNYFYTLRVYIEDEAGNDVVDKWCNLNDSEKEYILTETCKKCSGKSSLQSGGSNPKHFLISANLAYIYKDDFVVEHFRVFKDDAEGLTFNGICIDYDWNGKGAIEYTFKGVDIPIKEEIGRTYYNYEDGKYYTDEDYVSPYSEITLVRHNDGTYTVK
ncbi:MAG: hypothetical protein K2F61_03305 [Muribaculaceae bacterium]|nr:hypothetical protein [Muribaculaceae bacterium]MDE6093788.1 hypothetical protein [Muribaculaceae bacterium]